MFDILISEGGQGAENVVRMTGGGQGAEILCENDRGGSYTSVKLY